MSKSYFADSVKLDVINYPTPNSNAGATAEDLLQDYLQKAISKQKYQYRLSKFISWSLNIMVIFQVVVSGLMTLVTSMPPAPQSTIGTIGVALGALSTVIAALLARAKGSNQPELSESHAKDLEKFIGRCRIFIKESGSEVSDKVKAGVLSLVALYEAIEDKAVQADRGHETRPIAALLESQSPRTTATSTSSTCHDRE